MNCVQFDSDENCWKVNGLESKAEESGTGEMAFVSVL